jgi:hypothetical protein
MERSSATQHGRRQVPLPMQCRPRLRRPQLQPRPLTCSGLLLASLTAAAACTVSQDQEVAIGAANAAKVDSQMPIVHDTMVDRFVTALARGPTGPPMTQLAVARPAPAVCRRRRDLWSLPIPT